MDMKGWRALPSIVAVLLLTGNVALAHGGGNWDEFTIDVVNDKARGRALEVQSLASEMLRGRIGADKWPPAGLREMRDSLITVKEEVDEILEHYMIEGVNIHVASSLRAEPRAGRSVAASMALGAGIALIDLAATFDKADGFIGDFYTSGMTARLYELLEAHLDRMELYASITTDEPLAPFEEE